MPGTCTRARSHTSNCHHSPYPGAQEDTERTEQVGSGLSGKVGHKFEQMAGIGVEGKPGRTGGSCPAVWSREAGDEWRFRLSWRERSTIACLRPPGDTSAGDPGALQHKESACLSGRHAQLCGYADSVAACSNFVPSNMPIFAIGISTKGPHWRQRTTWTKGSRRSPRQRWC